MSIQNSPILAVDVVVEIFEALSNREAFYIDSTRPKMQHCNGSTVACNNSIDGRLITTHNLPISHLFHFLGMYHVQVVIIVGTSPYHIE